MSEQRKSIGSISQDFGNKDQETQDPIELQRSMQQKYIDELIACVDANKSKHIGDFFIVVITKREPLMKNVLRNYFFARSSCPTPDYDQAVYRYHSHVEDIEYLWCIPDRETCLTFKDNALIIAPEEKGLLRHILDFYDRTLYKLAKKLNREQSDSSKLEK